VKRELRAGSLSGSKPRVRERERENVSEKKKLFVYKSAPS